MYLRTILVITTLYPVLLVAQEPVLSTPVLHLKNRTITPTRNARAIEKAVDANQARVHRILQFEVPPTQELIDTLNARGITVVGAVPENGLMVTMDGQQRAAAQRASSRRNGDRSGNDVSDDLGVSFMTALEPSDKVSPLINAAMAPAAMTSKALAFNGYFLVEFHADVNIDDIRRLVLNLGVELVENPDLSANHVMVHFTSQTQMTNAILEMSANDGVAYIFPASEELAKGSASRGYAGAVTAGGAVGQFIATNGVGWDGAGQKGATLSYVFSQMTAKAPTAQVQTEILRAMTEWSKAIKLTWKAGTNPNATATVNILFGSGSHGDSYPFDGRSGVLAHTFYPAAPNPEPIAGDMHFDDDENWNIGVNTDIYSVTLHELGHALGLGHSDNPADVMYPYYKIVSVLNAGDKAAILTMYAAQDGTPSTPTAPTGGGTPAATPLTLTVQATAAITTATSINLMGSIAGGTGTVKVTWAANGAAGNAQMNGTTWLISNLPLIVGSNAITVTASDSAKSVSQIATVVRQNVTATPLTLTVQTLAATTTATSINLMGSVAGGTGTVKVTWAANGAAGNAQMNGTNWVISNLALIVGSNAITVTASDSAKSVSQIATVVRQNVTATKDTTPPSLTLANGSTAKSQATTFNLSGTASDNVGVVSVTWSTSTGANGTATGINNWTAQVPVLKGFNTVTVRATDAAGNYAWRSILITRQ